MKITTVDQLVQSMRCTSVISANLFYERGTDQLLFTKQPDNSWNIEYHTTVSACGYVHHNIDLFNVFEVLYNKLNDGWVIEY